MFLDFTFSPCGNWLVNCVWNVMAHAQKPDFFFRWNGQVHYLKRRGRQFSRLLAAEVWASAVVMLDTPCSEVVWRVLATHSIRQFPLHFPSRASPGAITFQLESKAARISFNLILQSTSTPVILIRKDINFYINWHSFSIFWRLLKKNSFFVTYDSLSLSQQQSRLRHCLIQSHSVTWQQWDRQAPRALNF